MNVLLIIDMQEASFNKSDKFESDKVIQRINLLSSHTRTNGGKVIFIQHDGTDEEGLFPFTSGWEILSTLDKQESDIVIRKTLNDAFCHTKLGQTLKELKADKILVSGWASDFCVDSTVRSAVSLGRNVVAIADCHTVGNRPNLKAKEVIDHHNWLWQNLLCTDSSVEVLTQSECCDQ